MATRRGFIASVLAAATFPRLSWADAGSPAYLGAAQEADGAYALFGLDEVGDDLFRIPLPARGHAAAAHPFAPEAVAFARRPGTFALVINCATGTMAHWLDAPEGRHFYGHGAFIAGGDILCTAENHIETGQGLIGLWSRADGYARIGEFPTGGIGPHDLKRLSGDRLVVANGGILTHPDQGRDKLNIDRMEPSLVYLSPEGEMLEQVILAPELHQNSIRHLALAEDETVAFAMQWEGDLSETVPLLGLHKIGDVPRLVEADIAEQMAMKGYAGSVSFDGAGQTVSITSPRGGRIHSFDRSGVFLGATKRADVCGLAPASGGYIASDGLGGLIAVGDGVRPLRLAERRAWDNHLVALGGLI